MDTNLVKPYLEDVRKRKMKIHVIPRKIMRELMEERIEQFLAGHELDLVVWSMNRKGEVTAVGKHKGVLDEVLGRREATMKAQEMKRNDQSGTIDIDIRRPGFY